LESKDWDDMGRIVENTGTSCGDAVSKVADVDAEIQVEVEVEVVVEICFGEDKSLLLFFKAREGELRVDLDGDDEFECSGALAFECSGAAVEVWDSEFDFTFDCDCDCTFDWAFDCDCD
jgi:hypothetical protein